MDNFNLWGVRRRSPSHGGTDQEPSSQVEDAHSEVTPSHEKKASKSGEGEWWEEDGSMSPSDDPSLIHTDRSNGPPAIQSQPAPPTPSTPPKLKLDTSATRRPFSSTSISE